MPARRGMRPPDIGSGARGSGAARRSQAPLRAAVDRRAAVRTRGKSSVCSAGRSSLVGCGSGSTPRASGRGGCPKAPARISCPHFSIVASCRSRPLGAGHFFVWRRAAAPASFAALLGAGASPAVCAPSAPGVKGDQHNCLLILTRPPGMLAPDAAFGSLPCAPTLAALCAASGAPDPGRDEHCCIALCAFGASVWLPWRLPLRCWSPLRQAHWRLRARLLTGPRRGPRRRLRRRPVRRCPGMPRSSPHGWRS